MMMMVMVLVKVKTMMALILLQVGPGDGYVLSAYGFNSGLSNIFDALAKHNGMKFSTW